MKIKIPGNGGAISDGLPYNSFILDEQYLVEAPLDMKCEPSDPERIHLSESDVVSYALPVSGERVMFYGTHLKYRKESSVEKIKYLNPGDEIFL